MEIDIRIEGPNRDLIFSELKPFFTDIFGSNLNWKTSSIVPKNKEKVVIELGVAALAITVALPTAIQNSLNLVDRAKQRKKAKETCQHIQQIMSDEKDVALIIIKGGASIDLRVTEGGTLYDQITRALEARD